MVPSKAELQRVAKLLRSQEWIFAKTMPENPHWYTLRKKWAKDQDFIDVVLFIRKYGRVERWPDPIRGREYTYLDLEGFHYWTMGWPVKQTILINRKPVPAKDSLE